MCIMLELNSPELNETELFPNLVKLLHLNCICLLAESISADSFVSCTKPRLLGAFQAKAIYPEYESASLKLSMLCGILKTGC